MRILFLTSSLAPHFGGAAVSESILSAELSKDNEVVVLSRRDRLDLDFATRQGIRKVIPFSPFSIFVAFLNPWHALNQEIKKAQIFHLNGHWFWENYFFARLCYRYGVPYVLHPRGMLWVEYRRPIIKRIFNFILGNWIVAHASKVILLSEYEKNQVRGYPINDTNLTVIPNGISSVGIEPELGFGPPYFLYLGRLEQRKNLEFLIQSFKTFHEKNPNFSLRLVGPVERNYDLVLENLVSRLNLGQSVFIEPAVYGAEKESLLRGATAVVYPAQGEPFGRTIFESFAAGTFCLVPNSSGGAEYVEKFAPTMLYPDHSEKVLAEKMGRLAELSKDESKHAIEEASSWIKQNLAWPEITQRVLETYQGVLNGQKSILN